MPKDNIERAVKKGTGELEGVDYQEILYEGYGPAGVALMIQTVTDNPNRTVAEIRHKLSRGGGNLGAANSVSWMFDRRGQIYLDAGNIEEDTLIEVALEGGAEDVKREDDQFVVTTAVADLHAVKSALDAKGPRVDERGDRVDSEEHDSRRGQGRRDARQAARGPRGAGRRAEGGSQLRHGRVGDGEGVTPRTAT
jgi:YebC/PmpR family DNA-binding regulatory protein